MRYIQENIMWETYGNSKTRQSSNNTLFRLRERHEQNTGLQEAVAKNGETMWYDNEVKYIRGSVN